MFFLLLFFIVFILIILGIPHFTTIEVQIKNLQIQIDEENRKILNNDYQIIISLLFFDKIKFFKTVINSEKIKNKNINIDKVKNTMQKNNFKINDINIIDIIKYLKINVKFLNLKVKIGTQDAALTAISTGLLCTIMSTVINFTAKGEKKWKVEPVYQNRNFLKVNIDSIFSVKMIHIINRIYHLLKKGDKVEKK